MWLLLHQSKRMKNLFMPFWRNNFSNHVMTKRFVFKRRISFAPSSYAFSFTNLKQSKSFVRYIGRSTNKPFGAELKKLLIVARPEWRNLSGALVLLLISSSVTMAVPFCVGKLIDIISSSNENLKENLVTSCYLLIAMFVLGALANFGRVLFVNLSSHRVANTLRKKAYASILCQETSFFDQTSTGELINRLSADTVTVGMSVTNNISDGLRSLFSFIAASSLMVYTSPYLAFLGLITVTPVAVFAVIFGKFLKKNSQAMQDALANAAQVADERLSNMRTVQAFTKIQDENKLFNSKIDDVLILAMKESLGRAVFFGLTGFTGNLIILSVLYYGGLMMNEGQITVGGLSSFLLYAAYVGISIGGLSTFYSELMRGLGATTRLWELIERKPLISLQDGVILPNFNGCVNFNNVSFAYPTRPDALVLSDFDLSIPSGSVCALVGSSGCGKSTVGSLLLRLYDCQKGTITVDGKDIKSLNVHWLRQNIGLVSQDPVLFSFTIRENILYGAPDETGISDSCLEEILSKANALEFVKGFPQGLDTIVGERGVMLSGGQRQRIAIARALLKDPKILILDEATSALDSESEFLVQRALEELLVGRTVITIAHRLSTIKKADVITVLEQGKIIEKGKYDVLVSNKGPFYHFVQHQSLK